MEEAKGKERGRRYVGAVVEDLQKVLTIPAGDERQHEAAREILARLRTLYKKREGWFSEESVSAIQELKARAEAYEGLSAEGFEFEVGDEYWDAGRRCEVVQTEPSFKVRRGGAVFTLSWDLVARDIETQALRATHRASTVLDAEFDPERVVQRLEGAGRTSHCYYCKSDVGPECALCYRCWWYECAACGACGCGYEAR